MYITAGTAGTVGSGTGLVAAHMGMDPVQAASLGAAAASTAGDLLRQLLRVPERDLTNMLAEPAVTGRTPTNTSSPSEVFSPIPRQRPQGAGPMVPRVAHHGRHRQLQRSARRFAERAASRSQREEGGHGAP